MPRAAQHVRGRAGMACEPRQAAHRSTIPRVQTVPSRRKAGSGYPCPLRLGFLFLIIIIIIIFAFWSAWHVHIDLYGF